MTDIQFTRRAGYRAGYKRAEPRPELRHKDLQDHYRSEYARGESDRDKHDKKAQEGRVTQ